MLARIDGDVDIWRWLNGDAVLLHIPTLGLPRSHAGKEVVPRWEQVSPSVGIHSASSFRSSIFIRAEI